VNDKKKQMVVIFTRSS